MTAPSFGHSSAHSVVNPSDHLAAYPSAYDVVNAAWKKTCNLLLGEEIGELEEYEEWLKELTYKNDHHYSVVSGKDVVSSIREYGKDSKFISFDEIDFNRRFPPLNINEVKDIDSIAAAIKERICYCGNVLIGNCRNVERSTNISDGFFVFDSSEFFNVQYIAYSTVGRENTYCFGTHAPGGSEFLIRCCQTVGVKRSFESWVTTNSSDCYYSYGLDDCVDCLFSFNLKNRRHCIGNLEISRDKYNSIKKHLLADTVAELRRKKSAPSLLDIIRKSKPNLGVAKFSGVRCAELNDNRHEEQQYNSDKQLKKFATEKQVTRQVKQAIEKEFSSTTRLILGKSLAGIDDYSQWLYEHVHKMQETKSAVSSARILWVPYVIFLLPLPDGRAVTTPEASFLGESVKLDPSEAEGITLHNAHECIGKIAYLKVDIQGGQNTNILDCSSYVDASTCYNASAMVRSKYCACGMWPKDSTSCFGFDTLLDSSFCLKCYHSTKLTRCFELDSCRSCADSMFCHNCENIHDSMFCFNGKNLRYAIGNGPLAPDQYKKVKAAVLEQINDELEKNRRVPWNIYNLACQS